MNCPGCQSSIEFWKDAPRTKCRKCGLVVRNPRLDIGCAEWCQYAEQCFGTIPGKQTKEAPLCENLLKELRTVVGHDGGRVERVLRGLDHADRILRAEGGDPLVVKAALILQEMAAGQPGGGLDGLVGPAHNAVDPSPVRDVLGKYGVEPAMIERVCQALISRPEAGRQEEPEARILRDATLLGQIPETVPAGSRQALASELTAERTTATGRRITLELLVDKRQDNPDTQHD